MFILFFISVRRIIYIIINEKGIRAGGPNLARNIYVYPLVQVGCILLEIG